MAGEKFLWTLAREMNGDRATETIEAEDAMAWNGVLIFYDGNRVPLLTVAPGYWSRVDRGPRICSCLKGSVEVSINGTTGACAGCGCWLPRKKS